MKVRKTFAVTGGTGNLNNRLKKHSTLYNLIQRNILSISFSLFLIFLVIFSQTNLFAAKSGLTLWAKNVVPSLFPFFIATELLNYTNIPYYLGRLTNKFMRPLFNVPRRGQLCIYNGNYKRLSCWSKDC